MTVKELGASAPWATGRGDGFVVERFCDKGPVHLWRHYDVRVEAQAGRSDLKILPSAVLISFPLIL